MPQSNEMGYEEKMGNASVASSFEGLNCGNDDDDQAKCEQRAITNNEIDRMACSSIDDLTEINFGDFHENFVGGYKRESEHR